MKKNGILFNGRNNIWLVLVVEIVKDCAEVLVPQLAREDVLVSVGLVAQEDVLAVVILVKELVRPLVAQNVVGVSTIVLETVRPVALQHAVDALILAQDNAQVAVVLVLLAVEGVLVVAQGAVEDVMAPVHQPVQMLVMMVVLVKL